MVFTGHIAGFGTGAGVRLVVGTWAKSPFGAFTDVMVATADDERILLAPTAQIADFVSSTYNFDHIDIASVTATLNRNRLVLNTSRLSLDITVGGASPIDLLLRLVPGPLATAPWWLRTIDPIASRVIPGVHTAGSAGNGRREYYGVRRARSITSVSGRFDGRDLAGVAPLLPPVRFGFSSAPPTPQIVAVTTTIDMPASARV